MLLSSIALAGRDAFDGDTPLYRCPGNDVFDRHGNHWLLSGEDPTDEDPDRSGVFAAMHWITGWPGEGDELRDVEVHVAVVPPRGARLPVAGIRQATSEVRACWVLRRLSKTDDAPVRLKDSKRPLSLICRRLPPNLQEELPSLDAEPAASIISQSSAVDPLDATAQRETSEGHVHVDARMGRMSFFGTQLRLVPHAGSAYLGITREFAVSLHKTTGAFRITLPQGRRLEGSCEIRLSGP